MATTLGFSLRQGPHQLAQKSTKTTFPLKEEILSGFPSGVVKVKSGKILPSANLLFFCVLISKAAMSFLRLAKYLLFGYFAVSAASTSLYKFKYFFGSNC